LTFSGTKFSKMRTDIDYREMELFDLNEKLLGKVRDLLNDAWDVSVQREMESGRAPLASIANSEGRPGGRGQQPKPQLVSRKRKSVWRVSFTAGRTSQRKTNWLRTEY
jgi:hypothetical protein